MNKQLSAIANYLNKRAIVQPLLTQYASYCPQLIVVIPAYKEKNIQDSLLSLHNANSSNVKVLVIVVVNGKSTDTAESNELNEKCLKHIKEFADNHDADNIRYVGINALEKRLGIDVNSVGLARKVGMDEALNIFLNCNNPDGVLICFDADSKCELNYLDNIYNAFTKAEKASGASIHYEHPMDHESIIKYELHLRYYINAQRYIGLPFAFQTVGSSMAVRAIQYARLGGMNRKQAGEDFYFLQKFIQYGNFIEINSTKVIPSSRVSDRVPFGTGRAILEMEKQPYLKTYDLKSFIDLKNLIANLPSIYSNDFSWSSLNPCVKQFLELNKFESELESIRSNTASYNSFYKRFFQWFDAFQLMKYVHFARDHFYEDVDIAKAAEDLLKLLNLDDGQINTEKELLIVYRHLDKSARLAPKGTLIF